VNAPSIPEAGAEVRAARRATAVVFAVHGCVIGSLAARLPWIASHVGVGVGGLGLGLLMPAIGALLAMPFSSRLAHRYAFRPLVTATIAGMCASLVLPALPTSLAVLCLVLVIVGATAGLADMAMNAQGVLIEKRLGRSVMSSFHGFWSVGTLVGSAVSAAASGAGVDTRLQFGLTAVVLAALGTVAASFMLDDTNAADDAAPPAFALPTRPVILIGLVGLCAVFGEQGGTDWSALYIRRELDGSARPYGVPGASLVSWRGLPSGLARR
jgi:MFS family permease